MIHVEYEKKGNYPHEREVILFDRSAFQSLCDEDVLKVSEKYNILCPQVFVMECIVPSDMSRKESLCRKLGLIKNPVVLMDKTDKSILALEKIAKNCITAAPMTMERVTPRELITHYIPKIDTFKYYVKTLTEACEVSRGSLTSKQLTLTTQRVLEQRYGMDISTEELRNTLRGNERTRVTQYLNYVAKEALEDIGNRSTNEIIKSLSIILYLGSKDAEKLFDQIQRQNGRRFTVENYPKLSYPIYIYYLMYYIIYARQHNTEHLDQSYVRDFRYLYYLNFCDRFITNETSTPFIVNSLPYRNIRETPVSTLEELKEELIQEGL